jgi:hypothetical protein
VKWKSETRAGPVTFAFATNSKTAGLLPHLPGEFRLRVSWTHKTESKREVKEVSWFQYTSETEEREYAELQRMPLGKFLAQPGKEGLRSIYNYAHDPDWLPRANFDEFAYYFDTVDAKAWGNWYASNIGTWQKRFEERPEGFNDWCWRVLWADQKRKPRHEA